MPQRYQNLYIVIFTYLLCVYKPLGNLAQICKTLCRWDSITEKEQYM